MKGAEDWRRVRHVAQVSEARVDHDLEVGLPGLLKELLRGAGVEGGVKVVVRVSGQEQEVGGGIGEWDYL